MRNFRGTLVAAVSMVCLAQAAGAAESQLVSSSSSSSSAPSDSGVLASVRIEFRAASEAVISIAPGLYGSSEPAEREGAVVAWPTAEGRLLVTYDGETDRLEAVLEDAVGSTAVVYAGAVARGFGKLDPLRFAPSVMGLLIETANRGAHGAIALSGAEVGSGRRPRPLQEIGAGAQAVSQLLHAERAMAHGFSLAATIRLTNARPAPTTPMTVELRLLADSAEARERAPQPAAPESSDGIFINSTPTTMPPLGTAVPYPSQITVAPGYMSGVLTKVVVGFDNLDHTYPAEMTALLVGPSGNNVALMRLACGFFDLLDADITFDDAAILAMPNGAPCFSGSWKPTVHGSLVFTLPPPAPGPFFGQTLAEFIGDSPTGTWSLFINIQEDFDFPDFGRIDAWSLTLTTAIQIPGSGSFGSAAPYPSTYTVSGSDPNLSLRGCGVYIDDLTHTYLGDLHLLFSVPSGQTSYLMGNACGSTNAVDLDWIFGDDPAVGFLPGSSCVSGVYRPTVLGALTFPAPAPAGPYGRSLAGVSGSGANGVYALYALDDASGDVGRIRDWSFNCSTAPFWIFGDGFETRDLLLWSADAP